MSKSTPETSVPFPTEVALTFPSDIGEFNSWFFTFTQGSPEHRNYLEIIGTQELARRAMFSLFGTAWAFQYPLKDFQSQPEEYGLTPLHPTVTVTMAVAPTRKDSPPPSESAE